LVNVKGLAAIQNSWKFGVPQAKGQRNFDGKEMKELIKSRKNLTGYS